MFLVHMNSVLNMVEKKSTYICLYCFCLYPINAKLTMDRLDQIFLVTQLNPGHSEFNYIFSMQSFDLPKSLNIHFQI